MEIGRDDDQSTKFARQMIFVAAKAAEIDCYGFFFLNFFFTFFFFQEKI